MDDENKEIFLTATKEVIEAVTGMNANEDLVICVLSTIETLI